MRMAKVHIRNYRCLEDVQISLSDLTVLLGPARMVVRSSRWTTSAVGCAGWRDMGGYGELGNGV
jgi:hypothetical protein